jgi:hypothetical protein
MNGVNDNEDPRRRLLLQALASGLLGAAPLRRATAGLFGDRPSKLPPGRSIQTLEGHVLVNGSPATLDTKISAVDTVETGGDGRIIFVVGKDAFLLRSNSRLVLTPEMVHQSVADSVIGNLKLLAGSLLSVFAKRRHSIETPTVVVGVRGTGVYMEVNPEETYFCTCYGIVDMAAAADRNSRETIETTHHNKPRYILARASSGNYIRPAPFKDHTDQELMLIEELVGRTPPFVFPGSEYNTPRREY